jgi:hypothetical protein
MITCPAVTGLNQTKSSAKAYGHFRQESQQIGYAMPSGGQAAQATNRHVSPLQYLNSHVQMEK